MLEWRVLRCQWLLRLWTDVLRYRYLFPGAGPDLLPGHRLICLPCAGCLSNCDATASCGQYAEIPGQTCPLNVCCSQFGYVNRPMSPLLISETFANHSTLRSRFCGTTSDFCGTGCQSGCNQPSSGSSGSNVQKRILGYYESCAYDGLYALYFTYDSALASCCRVQWSPMHGHEHQSSSCQ